MRPPAARNHVISASLQPPFIFSPLRLPQLTYLEIPRLKSRRARPGEINLRVGSSELAGGGPGIVALGEYLLDSALGAADLVGDVRQPVRNAPSLAETNKRGTYNYVPLLRLVVAVSGLHAAALVALGREPVAFLGTYPP